MLFLSRWLCNCFQVYHNLDGQPPVVPPPTEEEVMLEWMSLPKDTMRCILPVTEAKIKALFRELWNVTVPIRLEVFDLGFNSYKIVKWDNLPASKRFIAYEGEFILLKD